LHQGGGYHSEVLRSAAFPTRNGGFRLVGGIVLLEAPTCTDRSRRLRSIVRRDTRSPASRSDTRGGEPSSQPSSERCGCFDNRQPTLGTPHRATRTTATPISRDAVPHTPAAPTPLGGSRRFRPNPWLAFFFFGGFFLRSSSTRIRLGAASSAPDPSGDTTSDQSAGTQRRMHKARVAAERGIPSSASVRASASTRSGTGRCRRKLPARKASGGREFVGVQNTTSPSVVGAGCRVTPPCSAVTPSSGRRMYTPCAVHSGRRMARGARSQPVARRRGVGTTTPTPVTVRPADLCRSTGRAPRDHLRPPSAHPRAPCATAGRGPQRGRVTGTPTSIRPIRRVTAAREPVPERDHTWSKPSSRCPTPPAPRHRDRRRVARAARRGIARPTTIVDPPHACPLPRLVPDPRSYSRAMAESGL